MPGVPVLKVETLRAMSTEELKILIKACQAILQERISTDFKAQAEKLGKEVEAKFAAASNPAQFSTFLAEGDLLAVCQYTYTPERNTEEKLYAFINGEPSWETNRSIWQNKFDISKRHGFKDSRTVVVLKLQNGDVLKVMERCKGERNYAKDGYYKYIAGDLVPVDKATYLAASGEASSVDIDTTASPQPSSQGKMRFRDS